MAKTLTTIYIDDMIKRMAKASKINISHTCENAIRAELELSPVKNEIVTKLEIKLADMLEREEKLMNVLVEKNTEIAAKDIKIENLERSIASSVKVITKDPKPGKHGKQDKPKQDLEYRSTIEQKKNDFIAKNKAAIESARQAVLARQKQFDEKRDKKIEAGILPEPERNSPDLAKFKEECELKRKKRGSEDNSKLYEDR